MPDYEKLRGTLEKAGYAVSFFPTAANASQYLCQELRDTVIGFGGSQTVRDMGLFEQLSRRNTCIWHWDKTTGAQPKEATDAPVYICSVNGLSENGEVINIDGGGNRLASTLFGHQKVYFIVGKNKIAPDYESALWRARNIAAPLNARRLQKKTPCALGKLKCYDCASPERICAALTVFWKKPDLAGEIEIVLIDEDQGF